MATKRAKSSRQKHPSESPIHMSPSSSSSDSDARRSTKRSKKVLKRDLIQSDDSDDDPDDDQWTGNQEQASAISKKKTALAEHAKRRLSGKFGMVRKSMNFDQPLPDQSSPARVMGTGRVGALARARENQAKIRHSGGGAMAGENPLLISTEVMNNNYDEWMKMATDNKINVNNTWSFALIDYFHDMSLLKNPDSEGGINFQKASCTLDGCVKIWTSRVDSVATETGKLLSGLAEEANSLANQVDDDDDDDEAGQDSTLKAPKKLRSRAMNSNSLVDFNEKIKVKELELEFTVDPLFKKTCADFDEGGPGGILMSHLSIDSSMTIIFDASGKPFSQNSDDDSAGSKGKESQQEEEEEQRMLDISRLKSSFLDSVESFQTRSICPCLSNFKFSTSDSIQAFVDLTSLANVPEPAPAVPGDQGDGDDFFDTNQSPNLGADSFEIPDGDDVGDEGVDIVEAFNPNNMPNERDLVMALVDDESKRGETGQGTFGSESTGMFDYFDKSLKKSWAGPEHWKLRRTVAFKSRDEETQTTMSRIRREKSAFSFDFLKPLESTRKTIFQSSAVSLTLAGYKPPKPKSQRRMIKKITGSKGTIGSKQMVEQHCLPDDMHFNAAQLLRFDMKPKTTFSMRVKGSGTVTQNPGAEIDENYWARTAAAAAAQNSTADETNADEDSTNAIPFATQFFQDEADDLPDFEEEFDNPVGLVSNAEAGNADKPADGDVQMVDQADEHDLIAATQNLNVRVRPEFINYAKKAKRVDVKKLKENIWKELEELTNALEAESRKKSALSEQPTPSDAPVTDPSLEPSSSPKTFTKVIGGLRSIYPKEKMEEISTSFCFICLLHLANEKGLRIQALKKFEDDDDDEMGGRGQKKKKKKKEQQGNNHAGDGEMVEQEGQNEGEEVDDHDKYVGRLEELNVYKEPTQSTATS